MSGLAAVLMWCFFHDPWYWFHYPRMYAMVIMLLLFSCCCFFFVLFLFFTVLLCVFNLWFSFAYAPSGILACECVLYSFPPPSMVFARSYNFLTSESLCSHWSVARSATRQITLLRKVEGSAETVKQVKKNTSYL